MTTTPASAPRRIVFVNHTSPARADVSSLRMYGFARALSERGARTLLLTSGNGIDGKTTPVAEAAALIGKGANSGPIHVACEPHPAAWSERARTGKLPTPLRQAIIAYDYAVGGGVFPDWREGAERYLPTVAQAFRPDIVIGTFGNTDTWTITARLAARAGAPWIGDFKDNWSTFLPTGFAARTARRFAGMAHMTVYSEAHLREAEKWFNGPKTVIYSGFDHVSSKSGPHAVEDNLVTLVGSIYDPAKVALLIRALDLWRQQAGFENVTLAYAGNDGVKVTETARHLSLPVTVEDRGRLGNADLSALLASSAANAYIVHPPSLFQQKPLELLAAGRPVIAVPGESTEVDSLCRVVGGRIVAGKDETTLAGNLMEALASPMPGINAGAIAGYTWDAQAAILEKVIDRILGMRR